MEIVTTLPEFREQTKCLESFTNTLCCKCSNKVNLISNLKRWLAKQSSSFGSTEQQDCTEAFTVIHDILHKSRHALLLHFTKLFSH